MQENVKELFEEKAQELMELSRIYKVPMFFSFVDIEAEKYHNRVYSAAANGIHLTDDQIEKHILISNGFQAIPPREVVDMDMDMLEELNG